MIKTAQKTNGIAKSSEMKPVMIAGAGPVGCLAALYLAQKNIPVLLIEGQAELPIDLRASTFHPPSLDMMDEVGLTQHLLPQGLIVKDFQFRQRATNDVSKFHMSLLAGETNHPYRLQCEQYKMTRTVVKMLKDYPHAKVIFNKKVLGFSEAGDGVTLLTFDGDVEEKFEGSYLIGCDGANSRIRQSAAVKFDGLTYPERFLVVSTTFPFEDYFEDLSWVNYVSDPEEWCVLLKTSDLWRFQISTPLNEDPEKFLDDEFIEERLQKLVSNPKRYDIHHKTLYKVHQRVAETYRAGDRVLLAGDAAHVNNPLGGMGMNGGLHDSMNLCEKLVKIIHEGADHNELLDLYDRQRRIICVEFVQKQTMQNKKMMEAIDRDAQEARKKKFAEACSSPENEKKYLMQASMIDSVRESYAIQ